jgi:predicted DNA-binding transcriptional regulator AlpA
MSTTITNPPSRTSTLCTLEETALMLRKTNSALRWMIHNGTAPRSALIGGRRMFLEAEITAFIEAAFAPDER